MCYFSHQTQIDLVEEDTQMSETRRTECLRNRAVLLAFGVAAAATFTPGTTHAQDPNITGKILNSLALVVAPVKDGTSFGSGFCFYSTPGKSYYLTNQHVVAGANSVFLRQEKRSFFDNTNLVPARVYPRPRGDTGKGKWDGANALDVAVLVIDVGNCVALPFTEFLRATEGLGLGPTALGKRVGVAGYPLIRLNLAEYNLREVSPSVHFGTLAGLGNGQIEFDALIDHGNSGGPLFDVETGVVYGVVQQSTQVSQESLVRNNFAIDITTVTSYFDNVFLPYYYSTNGKTRVQYLPCQSDLQMIASKAVGLDTRKREAEWKYWCSLPDAVTASGTRR
jgi:S1-C subfamily serine protease